MQWGVTKETTLDSLKNKSIEVRQLFAKAANKAIEEGKTEDEAIFSGLSQVAILERSKQKELKKSLEEQRAKAAYIPEHIRVIQEAQELKKQQKIEAELAEENKLKEQVLKFVGYEYKQADISEMYFDKNGKLVIKYSDGKTVKTKNEVPEEVINKYISVAAPSVQKALEPVTTLNGTTPEIVFLSDGDIVMQQVTLED